MMEDKGNVVVSETSDITTPFPNGIGYRTESYGGSGERDAVEVMAFEIFELCNSDILDTLRNGILSAHPIAEKLETFSNELVENGCIVDMWDDDKRNFCRGILQAVEEITGKRIRYALWLTSKNAVISFYGKDMSSDNDCDSYQVGPIILSNIGEDGCLFGYEEIPTPIQNLQ